LAELDVVVVRAMEEGKDPALAVAKKKRLRDVTKDPRIDAARTPDELAAVWPEELK
jgi:hypothetical protein